MPIRKIDAKTLKGWLDNNEAILIDVREPAEHEAESISGSKLIPLSKICKQEIGDVKDKKLVVHCKAGKRGGTACEKLLSEDPALEIYNLEGGIGAWQQDGFDVKSSGKFFLPLDRQVQLTIGLGVLIGVILGYFVNSNFFLLSAFFGAGLTFAGVTGYCGLAILMTKMPWNKGGGYKSFCTSNL